MLFSPLKTFRKSLAERISSNRFRQHKKRKNLFPINAIEILEDRTLLTVFNLLPGVADGDAGSLRAAITEANTNGVDDEINLAAGTYSLSLGELNISDTAGSLAIIGDEAGTTVIDATSTSRVFLVSNDALLSFSDVTITGGNHSDGGAIIVNSLGTLQVSNSILSGNTSDTGGAIYNFGTMTITNSSVSGNTVTGNGGGIATRNPSSATIINSTISGNSASGDGGGGIVTNGGSLQIINTTFTGNSANSGGGIYKRGNGTLDISSSVFSGNSTLTFHGGALFNLNGTTTISETTLSGNSSTLHGGAIYNSATLTITASTISDNTANRGAGIYNGGTLTISNSTISQNTSSNHGGGFVNFGGPLSISNSTLAGNVAGLDGDAINNFTGTVSFKNSIIAGDPATVSGPDMAGTFISEGNNIVRDVGSAGGFTDGVNGDQIGTTAVPIDAMIGPLQDNGGPTLTHQLLPGSPAIDSGDNTGVSLTDQRGAGRIFDGDGMGGATVDIGSVEFGAVLSVTVSIQGNSLVASNGQPQGLHTSFLGDFSGDVQAELENGIYTVVTLSQFIPYGTFTVGTDAAGNSAVIETTGALVELLPDEISFDLTKLFAVTVFGDEIQASREFEGTTSLQHQFVTIRSIGDVNRGSRNGTTTFHVPDGTYSVLTESSGVLPVGTRGLYGTFTVEDDGTGTSVVTATTGALTQTGGGIHFDLSKLAEVTVLGTDLITPQGRAQQLFVGPFPPANRGTPKGDLTVYAPVGTYLLWTGAVSIRGEYGRFTVGDDGSGNLALTGTSGSATATGNVVGFDHNQLNRISITGLDTTTAWGIHEVVGSKRNTDLVVLPDGTFQLRIFTGNDLLSVEEFSVGSTGLSAEFLPASNPLVQLTLITNQAPTAQAGGPYSVGEGGTVQLDASGSTDPDQSAATLSYAWDFDSDGLYDDATGLDAQFSAVGIDGPTTVTIGLQVTDDSGVSDTNTTTISINNVAPSVSISGPGDGVRGQTRTFALFADDPSPIDQAAGFVFEIDFDGNGTTDETVSGLSGIAVEHVYSATGTFDVIVTATDKDGGNASSSHSITIGVVLMQGADLVVGGTLGNDSIAFSPGNVAGEVEVKFDGVSLGIFQPTGRLVAYGQAGDDEIKMSGSLDIPAWFYGGEGNDKLKGGAGHDVLFGETGDDLIVGKSGRDILVGGTGADRIVGNADDDILVAGFLNFGIENTETAVDAIRSEWLSSRTYEERIANIQGDGTGERFNGDYFLTNGSTVLDDDEEDVLTGSSGADWFFFDQEKDRATDLKDEVFANDLDFILD